MPRSKAQRQSTARLYRQIVLLSDLPLTDQDIAAKLACSEATILRARRKCGFRKKPPHKGFRSKLTPAAKAWIKANWQRATDHIISQRYGVTESTVAKWRTRLGLFYSHQSKWTRNTHPKGFASGTHSQSAREVMSVKSKAMWSNPDHILNSEDYRQKLSERSARMAAERVRDKKYATKMYSRAKRGRRPDLGDYHFRSRWEANYARYLNLLIQREELTRWEFEADTFWFEKIRRGVRSYTPDFKLFWPDGRVDYVEVKGWMDSKSQTKLRRMAKYHPHIKIEVFGSKEYKALERSLGPIITGWEK